MLDALDALTFPAFATCLLALIAACGIARTVARIHADRERTILRGEFKWPR
jgi:hypothetical protein